MPRNGTIAIAVALLLPLLGSAAEARMMLRVGDSFPPGHPVSENTIKVWMSEVERSVGDEISFQYYPSEQIGKAKDLLSLVASGVVDVGMIDAGYNADKLPLSEVEHLPGTYTTSCEGMAAVWHMMTEGTAGRLEWQPLGLHPIIAYAYNPFQVFTIKPFHSLADLGGRKIRTAGPAIDPTVTAIGAVPIRMPATETYQSLSRGTVDGGIFTIATLRAYGVDKLVKAGTVSANLGGSAVSYAMNARKWESLSPRVQAAMTAAGTTAMRNGCEKAQTADTASLQEMHDAGFQPVTLTAEDQAKLDALAGSLSKAWADALDKRGKPGSKVLAEFIAQAKAR
jgi:TRAP-type C4-dicarboxylate transport system substrate-binding protein